MNREIGIIYDSKRKFLETKNRSFGANRVPISFWSILGVFAAVLIIFGVFDRSFLKWNNIVTILMRMTILVPIALGVMLALIVRGIDLSSGTAVGLLGIILAMMIDKGFSLASGIVVIIIMGTGIGLVNGILVGRFNMNPFIATLAVMFIGNSMERVLTQGGLPIYLYGDKSGLSAVFREVWFGILFL